MFTDDNLAMAVLVSLVWPDRLVPEPDWSAIRADNPYDPDDRWFDVFGEEPAEDPDEETLEEFQQECGERFLNYGVIVDTVNLLGQYTGKLPDLTKLWWQVPCDPMRAAWPGWDGESDEFDITSFEGVALCAGLTAVDVQLIAASTDLAPLGALPLLEDFRTDSNVRDWTPLLTFPALRTVRANLDADVAHALTARGVTVTRAH